MTDATADAVSAEDMEVLKKVARLNMPTDRNAVTAPAYDGLLQLFDALDAVEIGETPPTNAFDPRWRDL